MKASEFSLPYYIVLLRQVLDQVATLDAAPSPTLLTLVNAARILNAGFAPPSNVVAVVRQSHVPGDLGHATSVQPLVTSFPTDEINAESLSAWAVSLP